MSKKITLKLNKIQARALAQALDYVKCHFQLGREQELILMELEKQLDENNY